MSRRSQVVRSATTASISALAPPAENFTWNAMLISSFSDFEIGPNSEDDLPFDFVRHTSLGTDVDFSYDAAPAVRIRPPVNGIYSVSVRAEVRTADPPSNQGFVHLWATTGGGIIDWDRRMMSLAPDNARMGANQAAHAGYPLYAGELVWARMLNENDVPLYVTGQHLSVTWEAELGQVFTPGGGG